MKWTIIFTTILLFILPKTVQGSAKVEQWNQYMNNVIDYINNNNLEAADYLLNNVFSQFQKSNLPASEEEVLQPVFLQAIGSIENQEASNNDVYNNMLRLQLALDARNSTYQPMWLNREGEIMQTFSLMEKSLRSNDMAKFEQSFAMFQEQYNIISPSLSLDLHKQELSSLQANILYVEEHKSSGTSSLNIHVLQLEEEMKSIFTKYSGDSDFTSVLWISTIMGSVIATSLLYAAMRKYIRIEKQ